MLVLPNQPVAAPALSRQPGARTRDRRILNRYPVWNVRYSRRRLPSIKPKTRAQHIDAGSGVDVLFEVHEYVDKPMSNLPRRAQRSRVVPIVPYPPAAT